MAYNLLNTVHIIAAGDMSSTITSDPVEVKNQDNIGVQLHWTGVPVGTFSIQVSANHQQSASGAVIVEGQWVTLPISPAVVAAGAPDDAYIDLNQLSAMYVRIVYTFTGGTGALDAYVVAKAV